MKRVPEVIDCWFDSGSMPFAQWHYPFENKGKINNNESFPADYISEAIDQTRGWFYTLLAVSTLLNKGISYKNVVCLGLVLDEKGQKMSKSKGNIIVPKQVIDKFGADCVRFYFYTVNPAGESKRFDFKDIQDLHRGLFNTLWQSYTFFSIYKDKDFKPKKDFQSKNLLDKWIVSRLENLNSQVDKNLNNFDIVSAARLFEDFVDDLSNWHIRRSRKRFQRPETEEIKQEASQTLYYVLLKLSQTIAPFTPFIAEELYQKLDGREESVHLSDYPKQNEKLIDNNLEKKMAELREIVAEVLAQRAEAKIKVRQPLQKLEINKKFGDGLLELLKDEVNVKDIVIGKKIKLDTKITKKLEEEGRYKEQVRSSNKLRKEIKLTPDDIINISCTASVPKIWQNEFLEKTGAKAFEVKPSDEIKIKSNVYSEIKLFKNKKDYIGIKKVEKNKSKT